MFVFCNHKLGQLSQAAQPNGLFGEGGKGGEGGGGLNHELREINTVFHDSRKFLEGFTFHVKSVQDGMIIVP